MLVLNTSISDWDSRILLNRWRQDDKDEDEIDDPGPWIPPIPADPVPEGDNTDNDYD